MTHFLQRAAWANLQSLLDRPGVEESGDGWSVRAYLESGRLGKRLYAPYGPVLDRPEAIGEALAVLARRAKALGAAYVRVEPTGNISASDLARTGLRRVKAKQPEHTQRINLERPFDEILADMRKSTRNLHRNYSKKGVTIRKSDDPSDVEHLIRLLDVVAERTGMHGHDSDYLRANARALIPLGAASIYLAEFKGEVIASALVFDDENRRYYAHAAADTEHRSLGAGSVLVSTMIEDAHAAGLKEFDLYGVVPPDVKDHAWSGFSDFKRSFGGHQVDYAGTWELPIKRLHYVVYTRIMKLVER